MFTFRQVCSFQKHVIQMNRFYLRLHWLIRPFNVIFVLLFIARCTVTELALVGDVCCIFVTFPCGVLSQVWYLIVSFPEFCRLSYFPMTTLPI